MPRLAPLVLAAALAAPAAAAAQSWYDGYGGDRDHRYDRDAAPSSFDWRSQLDRPGDYRCDAYWDAGRTDCDARWRDQRRRVSPEARRDYRELAGYGYGGYGSPRHGYDRYGSYGHGWSGRGYGGAWDRYGGRSGDAYEAAYGRPDIVYPDRGGGWRGRDAGRISWCRATYRSYDPGTGYYRGYSGRLIFCG